MTDAGVRQTLERAIIDTIREPHTVLDESLRVVVANRSFYRTFQVTPEETVGQLFFKLGNGQWDNPELRRRLPEVFADHTTIEEYEIQREFPLLGWRTVLLNAREIVADGYAGTTLLISLEDATARLSLEREKDELLRQKGLLLQEMTHRVNNSLHIIASILLLKAQTVQSEETRRHLHDAHERVMAVATIQEQLHPEPFGTEIKVSSYLKRLGESLAASMLVEDQPVTITVEAGEGAVTSEQAVSLGLITVELVINALKHAFPNQASGMIVVRFESSDTAWRLSVSDDGVGVSPNLPEKPVRSGLGTSIVEALARQLGGRVTTSGATSGTSVAVTVPRRAA
jgi:two-component sensor histidine kinase